MLPPTTIIHLGDPAALDSIPGDGRGAWFTRPRCRRTIFEPARPVVKSVFVVLPLFSLLAVAAVRADDTFTVLPQQVVSVGDGAGDTFLLESISQNDNSVVILLRPKGEDCNFRFVLGVGRSVDLHVDAPTGQSFLCKTTLRPIVDDKQECPVWSRM